jgi:hypothetical protein
VTADLAAEKLAFESLQRTSCAERHLSEDILHDWSRGKMNKYDDLTYGSVTMPRPLGEGELYIWNGERCQPRVRFDFSKEAWPPGRDGNRTKVSSISAYNKKYIDLIAECSNQVVHRLNSSSAPKVKK